MGDRVASNKRELRRVMLRGAKAIAAVNGAKYECLAINQKRPTIGKNRSTFFYSILSFLYCYSSAKTPKIKAAQLLSIRCTQN